MELFKFRLRRLDSTNLAAGKLDRLLLFPRDRVAYNPASEPSVIFLTPDGYANAATARRELSTTYNPGFRYTLDPKGLEDGNLVLKDNLGRKVKPDALVSSIRRVWPAFGLPGGRRELLLIAHPPTVSVGMLADSEVTLIGGAPTLWYMDDILTDSDVAVRLSSAIATGLVDAARDAVGREALPPPVGDENFPVEMRDGGVVLTLPMRSGGEPSRMLTLSAAYVRSPNRNPPRPHFPNVVLTVRFWIAIWKDIGALRWLVDQTIEPLDWTCDLWPPWPPDESAVLTSIAREAAEILLRRALEVSDPFFSSEASRFILPT